MVKPMIEAQELARRFNEDEAVWRSYEHKRALLRSRSQFVTLKRGQNLKYLPHSFTEHVDDK